jgi:alpha-beta hydrolase superfamily lysophospholipase
VGALPQGQGIVDGLFLNSPFFDFNVPWLLRRPLMTAVGRTSGRNAVPGAADGTLGLYGRACTPTTVANGRTTSPGSRCSASPSVPDGSKRSAAASAACAPGWRSTRRSWSPARPARSGAAAWTEDVRVTDAVLDVEHIVRWAPRLGPRVTIARFDGGMHDLTLSGKDVRTEVFQELGRWVDAFVPPPGTPEIEVPPAPEDKADATTA